MFGCVARTDGVGEVQRAHGALAPAPQLNLVPVGGFNAVRLKLKGLDISPTGPCTRSKAWVGASSWH